MNEDIMTLNEEAEAPAEEVKESSLSLDEEIVERIIVNVIEIQF